MSEELHQRLCVPWNYCHHQTTGEIHKLLQARLSRDWKTEQGYEIIDVGKGYYVIKFQSPEDYMTVLTRGPYKIFGHYLVVQLWEPNFQPANARLPKTAI